MFGPLITRAAVVRSAERARWFRAWHGPLVLLCVLAFAGSFWLWPSLWLSGPAASYVALAKLTREGECGAQLYDNGWYAARVLAQSHGAVSDVFTPSLPALPLLIAPLAFVPAAWLATVWAAGNVAALGLTCLALWAVLKRERYRAAVVLVLSATLFSMPLSENLARGQIYLVVLLLHTITLWAILRGRHAAGGAALALLFALKTTGLPLVILLIALRRWRSLAWAALGMGAIFLLSWRVCGLDIWIAYLTRVLPAGVLSSMATVTAFQTVSGFFQHLFRFDALLNPRPLFDLPLLAALSTAAVMLSLMAVTLVRVGKIAVGRVLAASSVLSVCLMPLAEQYHYLVLLAPFSMAAAPLGLTDGRARWVLALAAVCVFAPLPFKDASLAAGPWALLAYPRLYGALVLWAILVFRKT